MKLLVCLALFAATTLAADDSKELNEWGTYYKLEGTEFNAKQSLFTLAWNKYQDKSDKKTDCQKNDASFSRWYQSSKNSDYVILSYFCMTEGARGYEHIKVSKSREEVIEFQDSLKGFGIPDAGSYTDAGNLAGSEAEDVQVEKLALVNVSVEALKDDAGNAICVNPGTQTMYSVQRKTENGLDYYRFPISCDNTGPHSHMTHIEVAQRGEDTTLLAVVEDPERNTEFIAEKNNEIESGKQGGSAALCASVVTLILAPILSLMA